MRHHAVLIAAGLCVALPAQALAQSMFQHRITAPVGLEYDSNPQMTDDPSTGVSRLRISPSYQLVRKSAGDELQLKLGAVMEQSSNALLSRHRRDGSARVDWRRDAETTTMGFHAAYEQSAARAALLEETGQLSDDGTRTTRGAGALLVHELDERNQLSGLFDVKWIGHDSGLTPDHRLTSGQLEWSRAHAEGQAWFAAVGASHYAPDAQPNAGQPEPGSGNSSQRGVMLGYRSQPKGSPWDWSVSAGLARFTGAFRDTMPQGEAKLGYRGPRWSYGASISRLPVANNLLATFSPNTQARLRAEYRLTEFTTVTVDASYLSAGSSQADASRQLGLQVVTELSPLWRMSAQVRGTQVDRRSGARPTHASRHTVGLVFTYLHPDF